MKALWVLTRLRMMEVLRVPSTATMFFGLPLLLMLLVGLVFANGHPFERRTVLAAEPLEALGRFPELRVTVVERPSTRAVQTYMASAVMWRDARGWVVAVAADDEVFGRGLLAVMPSGSRLEVVTRPRFAFVSYAFAGVLAFSVVLSGLFGLGYSLVRYRQNLFLRKLATTPLSRPVFILGLMLGRGALVLVQVALMLVVAATVFRLPLTLVGAVWTMVICGLGQVVFLGVGFVLACMFSREAVLYDAISAVAWPIVLLSEMFFPLDGLPAWLAQAAAVMPSTQLVRLLRAVLLEGDASGVVPGLAVLLAWAVATLAVGGWMFRWNEGE